MNSGAWSRPAFNLNLGAWRGIRRRHPDPIGRALELRFVTAGSIQSALAMLQNRIYRSTIDQIDLKPPLFLVGHWRSGTTLLHELLALDDSFAAPTTYACFNPHQFVLARHRAPAPESMVRPTGDMIVSPSSPQEEEFALLCMGAVSPYEAFMFPSAINQLESLCDPDGFDPAQQQKWNDAMTWILKATAYMDGADKRLLVKSPTNSFRLHRLAALFPGAKFIRMIREPCAVFASTRRLWQTMWERYALTAPPADEVLVERILDTRLALEAKLKAAMRNLPPDAVATIRYEDLVADPRRAIETLYEQLALGDPSPMLPKVSAYMAQNPRPATSSAEAWRQLVQSRWSALFDEFGYPRR